MDTRTKIIGAARAVELAAGGGVTEIRGHFDPLLAEHGRMAEAAAKGGRPVMAVVTDPAAPYLPIEARAELAASLAAVDYVAMEPGVDEDAASIRMTGNFVAHVLSLDGRGAV